MTTYSDKTEGNRGIDVSRLATCVEITTHTSGYLAKGKQLRALAKVFTNLADEYEKQEERAEWYQKAERIYLAYKCRKPSESDFADLDARAVDSWIKSAKALEGIYEKANK